MRDIIETDRTPSGYVAVDSTNILCNMGYETMVFECTKDGIVLDWNDLDCQVYISSDEMIAGHVKMCQKWRKDQDEYLNTAKTDFAKCPYFHEHGTCMGCMYYGDGKEDWSGDECPFIKED